MGLNTVSTIKEPAIPGEKYAIADGVFYTLPDKIKNLTNGDYEFSSFDSVACIKKNCYKHQYRGLVAIAELINWCEQNFGNDWVWNWDVFYFKNQQDLLYFVLKWK